MNWGWGAQSITGIKIQINSMNTCIRKKIMALNELRLAKLTKENREGFLSYIQYKKNKHYVLKVSYLGNLGNLAT